MNNPIFKVSNLVYKKNNSNILNIKNFEFHRGTCYLINGNMACGKTLLLDVLTKNNNKYNGDIFYEGELLKSYSKYQFNSEITYVKQSSSAPYFKTVRGYLNDFSTNKSKNKDFKSLVSKMDFKYLLDYKMRDLSPSQLRWVSLAGAVLSFPKVLIIDELELHLSLHNIKMLCKILYRKCNYDGVTIIISTQNKEVFNSLSSININLNHGRITSVRTIRKAKHHNKK